MKLKNRMFLLAIVVMSIVVFDQKALASSTEQTHMNYLIRNNNVMDKSNITLFSSSIIKKRRFHNNKWQYRRYNKMTHKWVDDHWIDE